MIEARALKIRLQNIPYSLNAVINNKNAVFIAYNDDTDNWGDALNKYLVEKISGKTAYSTISTFKLPQKKAYSVIGSILSFHNLNNIEVWGTGVISDNVTIEGKPIKVHALRGPLTAGYLKSKGIESPDIYGDPAILLPLFYTPKVEKKYKLGVILHKLDRDDESYEDLLSTKGVLDIDIYSGTTNFIDQVASCEFIASSSLHGLIAADSYNIPRTWLHGGAVEKHDRFKFDDYFLGMGFTDSINPHDGPLNRSSIIESSEKYSHAPNLVRDLLEACPFKETS